MSETLRYLRQSSYNNKTSDYDQLSRKPTALAVGVCQELVDIQGHVAFEVGEVKGGELKLEELVVPLSIQAGFNCQAVMVNSQQFTKTSNIWGVDNNKKGTNTNRIAIFKKE